MKVPVLTIAGEDTGRKAELKKTIFEVEPNDHAIYLDVKQFMAANRQGTAQTKERAYVTGSSRKIKRQKGTGTARAGNIKSPLFRGGGRAFGPIARDYDMKINKKVKQLARRSALTYKAREHKVIVLEDFQFEAPKTKSFIDLQHKLQIDNKRSLVVLNTPDKNIYLSARNLHDSKIIPVAELNTYDIMHAAVVVFVESSLKSLQ
jgi:large subunit ribosomal protein L4